ncbi:MAG: hypothetical protein ABWU84_12800, partial [Pyrobaculum sp.]|uniref:hypothetical protein n=1 Tax=Pyrobaculum sp. TaxID=2004705 RepID=UPI003EEEB699
HIRHVAGQNLIIAIAVGWYLYNSFASAGGQSGLVVSYAKVAGGKNPPLLCLKVTPQGAASVQIQAIEVAGQTASGIQVDGQAGSIVRGPANVTAVINAKLAVGQVVSGRVILSTGAIAPFTATVTADNEC